MAVVTDPSQLSESEFEAWVRGVKEGGTNTAQVASAPSLPPSVAPETHAALAQASDAFRVTVPNSYVSPEAARMGIRPGVFLNTRTGAGAATRFSLGMDENQVNQFKFLVSEYGPENVDISDEGRFILRNQRTPSGGVEDVLVDPAGLEGGDLAQLSAQTGPIIAGTLGARAGGRVGTGVTRAVSGALGAALGTAVAGGAQDTYVRWLRDHKVELSDIGAQRAWSGTLDAALGLAMAGGLKTVQKVGSFTLGLAQVPVGTTAARTAQRELAEQTGVTLPLTPAQESGSRLLARGEAIAAGRPGSSGVFDRIVQAQREGENELRRVFHGLPRTMTDDELVAALPQADVAGQRALRRLGTEAERLEGQVASTAEDVLRTGTQEAQDIAGVNLIRPLDVTKVGRTVRDRALSDFQTFRADMGARYESFLSLPEVTQRTVSGDAVAQAVSKVESKFVPGAVREGETETLEAFVPSRFRGFVDQLKDLKGAQLSVNDLKRIRTSIDNSIAEGVAIPGTDVAQLEGLRGAVDDSITTALKDLDPKLLTQWESLKGDYASGMSRFNKTGIRELLVREGERGSLGDTLIAERIIGNSPQALDNYKAYKSFLGPNSGEFKALQQVARQDALIGSLGDTLPYVDGTRLRANLRNLRPEVAEELFGTTRNELARIGEILESTQGKLDVAQLSRLARDKSLTASSVKGLIDAETERAVAFNNKLIKAAARGQVDAEVIKPSEFVRYATRMDPDDATRVMGILSDRPDLLEDIRRLGVEEIWGRVQAGAIGQKQVSGTLLDDALGSETQRRTWRAIVGNDTVDGLNKLVKTLAPREVAAATFKGAGQLAGASDVGNILFRGEVGALKEAATRMLIGVLYSGPMKRPITNLLTSQDAGRVLNAAISSEPFIDAVQDRFGPDGALLVMDALRETVEPLQRKELIIEGTLKDEAFDPSTLSEEDFKRWIQGTQVQ